MWWKYGQDVILYIENNKRESLSAYTYLEGKEKSHAPIVDLLVILKYCFQNLSSTQKTKNRPVTEIRDRVFNFR